MQYAMSIIYYGMFPNASSVVLLLLWDTCSQMAIRLVGLFTILLGSKTEQKNYFYWNDGLNFSRINAGKSFKTMEVD